MSVAKQQLASGLAVLMAVADTIKEAKQVPSGVLYAALMGKVDKQGFDSIINTLCNSGVIRREANHMLVWNIA